jgi:hypothetical protein
MWPYSEVKTQEKQALFIKIRKCRATWLLALDEK